MTPLRPLTAIFACLTMLPAAAADFSAWTRHADLALNAATIGVAGTVTGFPLLVRLDTARFDFNEAQASGGDIRFSKPDGTLLPHEIAGWNLQTMTAEIWVRLDTLRGAEDGQSIRMHWGNPAAVEVSDPNAVFAAADGFVGAWHLGGSEGKVRPNAVLNGNPASPANYDGDETTTGIIGSADSLDGTAAGDHLDLGVGYADFSGGFSFSAWIQPTAVRNWGRILDLGNGQGLDNIILTRVLAGDGIGFHNFQGASRSVVETFGQIDENQWQLFSVAVSDSAVRIYKNGDLVLDRDLTNSLAVATRTLCYLGRSNWAADQYYQGKIDEPVLARQARSDAWMRLQYLNQKPDASIPAFPAKPGCAPSLALAADTAVAEGADLTLVPDAPCATSFAWSVESGPAPRILDPESPRLDLRSPRVSGETVIVYRLTVGFPDSSRSRAIRVRVWEAIPDPAFALPADGAWNGKDPIAYRPTLTNMDTLRATGDTLLHWAWTFTGAAVDTAWLPDGVRLLAGEPGPLAIRLCLDNGGTPFCREGNVAISPATSLARIPERDAQPIGPWKDALGRTAPGRAAALPLFLPWRAPQ